MFAYAMVLMLALALAACAGGGNGSEAQDLTVRGLDSFQFDPATLSGTVGEAMNVTLQNAGVLEHNFVIDEFDVHLGPIPGGQSSSGSFTPSTAGSFTYYCDVPGHREAGMTGTLTVTE
jgi:plastocyanin